MIDKAQKRGVSCPNNTDRMPDGTFAPGNRLGGNKAGSKHRVTRAIETLLEGQHEALTQKAIEMALGGDIVALRLCLDRIAPPRKDTPVAIDLPVVRNTADAVQASCAVLDTVSKGNITPDEAARIMALLVSHKGLIETCEIETRLVALEARMQKSDTFD